MSVTEPVNINSGFAAWKSECWWDGSILLMSQKWVSAAASSYYWKERLLWVLALLCICLASSFPVFLFPSECSQCLPWIFHTDSRRWQADTQSEIITASNMSYLGLVDGFPPFLLLPESLRDFRMKQGLLFCCSSTVPSSQMCVTIHSIILGSFEIIFWLCPFGRILTSKHQYTMTVFLSVICSNIWMMKILVSSVVWVSLISPDPAWIGTNCCILLVL